MTFSARSSGSALSRLEKNRFSRRIQVITERDAALTELRNQGLTVRLHSGQNDTWHIADGGLYSGYVASGDELVELRSANKLNIRGIKELG